MRRYEVRWFELQGHRIGVVECAVFEAATGPAHRWCVGAKSPVAVVIERAGEPILLGIDGERLEALAIPLPPSALGLTAKASGTRGA